MMEKNQKRIFYFDELRVFAILSVILCHVGQYFPTTIDFSTSPTVLSYISLGRMGVPLFFMLSGALLINRQYTLGSFFKKRLPRIIVPAIFWLIIERIIAFSYLGFNFNLLINVITNANTSWFVYALLGIYIIMPLLNSFIKEYGDRGAEYLILVWIIFIIGYTLGYDTNNSFNYIFDNFGIYTGFPVLGYYLANKNFKIYSLPMIIICSIILIACAITNIYISWTYTTIILYYSLILIIETSALFLIFRYISRYCELNPKAAYAKFHNHLMNSWFGKAIYIISLSSYTMYFLHFIVIRFIAQNFIIDKFYMIPQMFALISILCILIVLILARIPIINKLSGVH